MTPLPTWPEHALRDGALHPAFLVHARARVLATGRGAVLTARSAALLWGLDMLVEPRKVEVTVAHTRQVRAAQRARRHHGVQGRLPQLMRSDLPVLPADSVVLVCARQVPLLEAVVIADSGLRTGAVTVASLQAAAAALTGQQGRARAQQVLRLVDPRAESVLESALRVRLLQAGLPGLVSQFTVRSPVRRLLRVDLAFPAARLAVETDGKRWHQDAAGDQRIDNALASCGWRVLRYSWADVVYDVARVVAEVTAALSA